MVFLNNENLSSNNPVETAQATATSTPSFNASVGVSDTNVGMSGSASASQTSSASNLGISVIATANVASDVSGCSGPQPCIAEDEGITKFDAVFCLAQGAAIPITGSAQASMSQAAGQVFAVAALTVSNFNMPPMDFVDVQAFNGTNEPFAMIVPLPAGCYDFNVQVFATDNGPVSATGIASSNLNVLFGSSP